MRFGRRRKDEPAAEEAGSSGQKASEGSQKGCDVSPEAENAQGAAAPAAGNGDAAQTPEREESEPEQRKGAGKGKWGLLGVLALLVLSGAALMLGRDQLSVHSDKALSLIYRDPVPGTLQEEKLAPFFLPMPEGGEGSAFRLDVLVRWERSTAARFRKEAPWIRSNIYERLLGMMGDDGAIPEKRDRLEEVISGVLRKSLGDKYIQIVLEQIRAI